MTQARSVRSIIRRLFLPRGPGAVAFQVWSLDVLSVGAAWRIQALRLFGFPPRLGRGPGADNEGGRCVRFLRCLIGCAVMAGSCFAQLPDFYKRVNRVIWLVKSLDHPVDGWAQLGLSGIRKHDKLAFEGQYRGKAV